MSAAPLLRSVTRRPRLYALMLVVLSIAACSTEPDATPVPSPSASDTPSGSARASAAPSATTAPSPTPEPSLTLALPEERDPRTVSVAVEASLDEAGGQITVTVTSAAETRIDDLVVRWPTALDATLALAPFVPSEDRIREGGEPLVQPWTKWVIGPGERGEPAGTTSLGYGPLLPGATLDVLLYVDRVAPGPVAFDLQLLADNDLLVLADGTPAELRVEIP